MGLPFPSSCERADYDATSAIADSLAFTIDQMAIIDEAYRAALPDRG